MKEVAGELVQAVLDGAKKATSYLSPREVVKATYQGKRDRRNSRHTVLVTVGAPNYAERKFIKTARAAGESFPLDRIQLKFDRKK